MPEASDVYRKYVLMGDSTPRGSHVLFGIVFSINMQTLWVWETNLNNNDMADTFSQIYIQVVFAVQNRNAFIKPEWEEELYKYITGITQNKGQKMLAINGTNNHIHFFIGMKPTCCLSDLVREIKKSSNSFIKEKKFTSFDFQWQAGFGAFSYSHSQLTDVIQYIEKQKEHHKKKTFKEEYLAFLKAFEIEFKDEYLFEWIDDV
jgi:REP element-mobilizing transposase RayT